MITNKTVKVFAWAALLLVPFRFSALAIDPPGKKSNEPYFHMRGIVVGVDELESMDWPKLAAENGINTIGTHIFPEQVKDFLNTDKGKTFLRDCKRYNIDVEHQLHAMKELLPRELFLEDSTMFRMDEAGKRVSDYNCCVSSGKALNIIADKAVYYASLLPSTNHRYYFWLDDNVPTCVCPECSEYSPSEQALIIENRIISALRKINPEARLAHLAYLNTLPAPRKVKPEPGIFLEFAPIERSWQDPLADLYVIGRESMSHAENIRLLQENLEVFSPETAVVLEYWLDVSLFSDWKKPYGKLDWNKTVYESDLSSYAAYGIRNVTTFGIFDKAYFDKYPDKTFLKQYGDGLLKFKEEDKRKPDWNFTYSVREIPIGSIQLDGNISEDVWKKAYPISDFINPWNPDVNPSTALMLLHDDHNLYFYFNVEDRDVVVEDKLAREEDITRQDRVELLFSKDEELSSYIVFEIDPAGRILDYKAKHYRDFAYDWNTNKIRVVSKRKEHGYDVEGAVALSLLKEFAGRENILYWGAFRAEFSHDTSGRIVENWLCLRNPGTSGPDFHVPGALSELLLNGLSEKK